MNIWTLLKPFYIVSDHQSYVSASEKIISTFIMYNSFQFYYKLAKINVCIHFKNNMNIELRWNDNEGHLNKRERIENDKFRQIQFETSE